MADTPFGDASGLLGIPPEYLAQFQLPDEEKKRLLMGNILLGISAGAFNSRKGNELGALGSGVLQGAQLGQNAVAQAMKQRGESITQAGNLYKLGKDMDWQKRRQEMIYGGDQPSSGVSPSTFNIPGTPQPSGSPFGPAQGQGGGNTTSNWLMAEAQKLGVLPEVRAALANPNEAEGWKQAMGFLNDARKPIFGQGKLPMVPDGQGGYKVANVAGYNEQLAAQVGAEEGAKAAHELVQVPQADGTMRMMPKSEALKALAPQAPRVQMDRQPTAKEAAWIAANGGPSATLGITANPLQMKEAEAKIATQAAQDTEVSKSQGQDFIGMLTAEKQAPANIGKLEMLRSHLSKVETGAAAPTVQNLKAYAAYFAPDLSKSWTQDTPYAQAATSLANEMALQLRNPAGGAGMPGSLSDSDRNFLVSMSANVANDPRAIPMMIDARIALEKRSQEVGKIARDYRAKNGKIDDGLYAEIAAYANAHPLFEGQKAPEAPAMPKFDRAALEAEAKRRNLKF